VDAGLRLDALEQTLASRDEPAIFALFFRRVAFGHNHRSKLRRAICFGNGVAFAGRS
jgi:hypothetical protein